MARGRRAAIIGLPAGAPRTIGPRAARALRSGFCCSFSAAFLLLFCCFSDVFRPLSCCLGARAPPKTSSTSAFHFCSGSSLLICKSDSHICPQLSLDVHLYLSLCLKCLFKVSPAADQQSRQPSRQLSVVRSRVSPLVASCFLLLALWPVLRSRAESAPETVCVEETMRPK